MAALSHVSQERQFRSQATSPWALALQRNQSRHPFPKKTNVVVPGIEAMNAETMSRSTWPDIIVGLLCQTAAAISSGKDPARSEIAPAPFGQVLAVLSSVYCIVGCSPASRCRVSSERPSAYVTQLGAGARSALRLASMLSSRTVWPSFPTSSSLGSVGRRRTFTQAAKAGT